MKALLGLFVAFALVYATSSMDTASAENSPELGSIRRDLSEIRKDVGILKEQMEKLLSGLGRLDSIDKKLEKLEPIDRKLEKLEPIEKKLEKLESIDKKLDKLAPIRQPLVVSCNGCNQTDAVKICTELKYGNNLTIPVPGNVSFSAAIVCYD